MNFSFDQEKLTEVVNAAVFNQLIAPETQAQLVKDAIAGLLVPREEKTGYYGNNTVKVSPLQKALEGAVEITARNILADKLKESEDFKEAVEAIVAKAVKRLMDDAQIVDQCATGISESIIKAIKNQF